MMRHSKLQRIAIVAVTGTLIAAATPVLAETVSYIDFEAGAGYASNPFLRLDDESSIFGRLSAFALHSWRGERGATTLTGYVENDTYLKHHGSKQIFALSARTDHRTSERVNLFGSLNFSGDIAGQLSNRFVPVPSEPTVPDPNLPPETVDPDLFNLTGRQYRLGGQVGASITASERSSVSVSAGAQRIFFSGQSGVSDYTVMTATLGYNRKLSELSSVGFRVSGARTKYDDGENDSAILNPQVTFDTRLSEGWDLTAAAGVSLAEHDTPGGKDSSANISLNGSLCRSLENERICGRVARYTHSSGASNLVTTSSAYIDFSKTLDDKQSVQASAGLVNHNSEESVLSDLDSNYFAVNGSYNRKLNDRLSAGATVGARRLYRDGPDPKMDLSASLFLRLRVGDSQ